MSGLFGEWEGKNKKGVETETSFSPTTHNINSTVAPYSWRKIIIKINHILQGLNTFEPRLCHMLCFNYSSTPLRMFRGMKSEWVDANRVVEIELCHIAVNP